MKKLILPGLTAVMLCMASPQESLNAQTPIIQTKFTADPAPMVHKGTVYLYTTHDEDYAPEGMAGFRMKEWLLYTSTDMVNWTDHGTIANLYNFKWADPAVSGWGGFENGAWLLSASSVMGSSICIVPCRDEASVCWLLIIPLALLPTPLENP